MGINRYLVIEDGKVINVILWDPLNDEDYTPDVGVLHQGPHNVGPGWGYVNDTWIPPEPLPKDPGSDPITEVIVDSVPVPEE